MLETSAPQSFDQYLTIAEAAAFVGVSPWTLRNWDRAGKLKAIRHPVNGYRIYRRHDLEAVLQTDDLPGKRKGALAPCIDWNAIGASEHFVQFYETDAYLVESVAAFIGKGLVAGEAVLVIATQAHRSRLHKKLKSRGLDLSIARASGKYVALDAAETLANFMVDGAPDKTRFIEVVGTLLARLGDGRRVRAFGEMVALLWAEDNRDGAHRLEELWNELARTHAFALFCAYPLSGFGKETDGAPFSELCSCHSRVIPAESYAALSTPDEQLRAITVLQQKASAVSCDVTERKQTEEKLRQSEQRFSSIFNQLSTGIAQTDLTGRFVDVNQKYCEIVTRTRDELLKLRMQDITHPDDLPQNAVRFQRLAAGGEDFVVEKRYVRPDGSLVWVNNSVALIRDTFGRPEAAVAVVRDISEQHRAQAIARGQKRAFELALTGAPIDDVLGVLASTAREQSVNSARTAIFIIDEEGACLRFSAAAGMPDSYTRAQDGYAIGPQFPSCGLAAHTGENVIVRDVALDPRWTPWLHLAQAHAFRACWSFPIRSDGGQVLGTFALYHADPREPDPTDLDLVRLLADTAGVLIARHKEVAKRERAEAALRRSEETLRDAEQELRDADRRKDEFLAMLSHELRNPLAPLSNAAQLLRLVQASENAIERQATGIIERQVARLKHLVDQLLEITRITTGRIQLRREPVTMQSVVDAAVETVRPMIDQRKHQLRVSQPPEPLWLEADGARLEQVVVNLLNNAAKYTDEGGRIDVVARQQGSDAVLSVRDTGIGIPPALLPHVFDLFSQAERSLDRSQGGLGIGLSVVKRLVELHGGSVEVFSELGQGTEFVVRLPVVIPAAVQPSAKTMPSRPKPTGRRVLVVDDSIDTAESLALLLEASGHEVRIAHDGPSALEAAREYLPDAAMLDIGLPGLDGFEIAKRMRAERRLEDIVLIALTGYGQAADQRRSREAGFDRHLVKPIEFGKVQEILSTVKARHRERNTETHTTS